MGDREGTAAVAPVDPGEEVCRLCFEANLPLFRASGYPNQLDDEGMYRLEEISWKELREDGFSLQLRSLYSLAQGIQEAARRNALHSERRNVDVGYTLTGALVASVAAINAISTNGAQVFAVFETPKAGDPGHAEVLISHRIIQQEFLRERRALRRALGVAQPPNILDPVAAGA